MRRIKLRQSEASKLAHGFLKQSSFLVILLSLMWAISLWTPLEQLLAQTSSSGEATTVQRLDNPTKLDLLQTHRQTQQRFEDEMLEVAQRCEELSQPNLASLTRAWIAPQDPSRQYLYLPPANYQNPGRLQISDDANEVTKFWAKKVKQLRQDYATKLIAQAIAAADLELGSYSSHWIAFALHQDPGNEVARTVLGHTKSGDQWTDPSWEKITAKKARKPAAKLGWKAGDYFEANSPNFRLLTNASEDEARRMLRRLQVWRTLWRQTFLAYVLNPAAIKSSLNASRPFPSGGERKHEVVLFSNRQEFLAALAHVKGVEKSIGYYDPGSLQSFFYLDDGNLDLLSTWQHETTHQLFQEIGRRTTGPGEQSNFWLVEGIAMYFESLRPLPSDASRASSILLKNTASAKQNQAAQPIDWFDQESFADDLPTVWSLGGFESQRLQYARIRWQREGYFSPLDQFFAKGRVAFQSDLEIARLYAQAGGFCHFLMTDGSSNATESPSGTDLVLSMLTKIYAGRSRPDMVETLTNQTIDQLTPSYQNWLSLDAKRLAPFLNLASDNQELALGYSALNDDDLKAFLAPNLFLLQLSATQITDASADAIAAHRELQQLFLDKTALTDDAILKIIAANPKLQSLDLSGTAISDRTVQALTSLTLLESLWLTSTNITDQSVKTLQSLETLKRLDVRGTKISDELKAKLASKNKE